MKRLLLHLRILVEGTAGFLLLLTIPIIAFDLLHQGGNTGAILIAWLVLSVLFFLGIFLFRDAVILRMRLKARNH